MGEDGFPPLRIRGRQIAGGHLEIPGSVSSQYISALLLIGPVLRDGLTLRMTGEIVSRPYIDLTLCTMRERSEEHTSELQSRQYLVCRLLLEKKKSIYSVKTNDIDFPIHL